MGKLELPQYKEFIVYALASKKYIHNYVDKIYLKDSENFDKSFRQSGLAKSNFYGYLPSESLIYSHRIGGIMVSEERDYGKSPTVSSLISRAFKPVQKFFNNNKKPELNLMDFEKYLKRDVKISIDSEPEETFMYFNVLVYLNIVSRNEKKLKISPELEEELNDQANVFRTRLFGKYIFSEASKTIKDVGDAELIKHIGEVVWPYTPTKMKATKYISSFPVLDPSSFITQMVSDTEAYKRASKVMISESLKDILSSLELFFSSQGSEVWFLLEDLEITKKEVVEWAGTISHLTKITCDRFPTKNELVKNIVVFIYLKALFVDYNKAKELLLELSQNVVTLERKLKSSSRTSVDESTLVNVSSFSTPSSFDTSKEEEYEARIRELEKRNRQLEEELSQVEEHSGELAALRSFVYTMDSEDEELSYPSQEFMINAIQSKRVVVVGGQPTWIPKMKSLLPEVRFLEASKKPNISFESIKKADVVILSTYQLNHPNKDRAVAEAESNSVPIRIIGKEVNEELSIQNIYNAVKSI